MSTRRAEREARRHQRELERLAKEQAKFTALENARLEVETYENRLAVLLSIHKEQDAPTDWNGLAVTLRPPRPTQTAPHEFAARQRAELFALPGVKYHDFESADAMIEHGRAADEEQIRKALGDYAVEKARGKKMKALASRVLMGEPLAYLEALAAMDPLDELSEYGSPSTFTAHSRTMLECSLRIKVDGVLPKEAKTLTSTGKVSVKPLPKARLKEIYECYICGCVLRVAREVFAFLPIVDSLLVTASAEMLDLRTGQTVHRPVLSVAYTRSAVTQLDFNALEPSAAIENFPHRTAFGQSRWSTEEEIVPLSPADLAHQSDAQDDLGNLVDRMRALQVDIDKDMAAIRESTRNPTPSESAS